MAWPAWTEILRASATSTLRYDGPRTGLRDAEPIVNGGATAKAAVLNHCPAVRAPAANAGSPMRCGRWTPKPANALELVVCVTATGAPGCSGRSEETDQPFAIAPRGPRSCRARAAPSCG